MKIKKIVKKPIPPGEEPTGIVWYENGVPTHTIEFWGEEELIDLNTNIKWITVPVEEIWPFT